MTPTQTELLEFLEKLSRYIDTDRVTEEDDAALEALLTLKLYVEDDMTSMDFAEGSPLWAPLKDTA